jgi:hypothetical protein
MTSLSDSGFSWIFLSTLVCKIALIYFQRESVSFFLLKRVLLLLWKLYVFPQKKPFFLKLPVSISVVMQLEVFHLSGKIGLLNRLGVIYTDLKRREMVKKCAFS